MKIKKGSTLFLRGVVWLMGAGVLTLCVLITTVLDQAGYYSLVLVGMLIAAIPFFIALYHTLKLLALIEKNSAFSDLSVKALNYIKYCAVAIAALYTAGLPFIIYAADRDDAPGAVLIGLVIVFASVVVAVFAAVLQKLLKSGLEIKSENDLTV